MQEDIEGLKARIEELKHLLEGVRDKQTARAIRLELIEAQEELNVLQTKQGSKPKRRAKRGATMGGKRGVETGGFYSSTEYDSWKAQQIEDDREGPDEHEVRRSLVAVGMDFATPRQREMILLHIQGMGQKEIAEALGVDKSTVSRTLRRGIGHVKDFADSAEALRKSTGDLNLTFKQMPMLSKVESLALRAAESRCEIWEIADLLGRDIGETAVILDRARGKLRKD